MSGGSPAADAIPLAARREARRARARAHRRREVATFAAGCVLTVPVVAAGAAVLVVGLCLALVASPAAIVAIAILLFRRDGRPQPPPRPASRMARPRAALRAIVHSARRPRLAAVRGATAAPLGPAPGPQPLRVA